MAVGAAIQAQKRAPGGDVKDVLLLDVTLLHPRHRDGVGGVATGMIPRNTTIPTRKTQDYTTYSDNQPGVEIKELQGERPLARDNNNHCTIHHDGIPACAARHAADRSDL